MQSLWVVRSASGILVVQLYNVPKEKTSCQHSRTRKSGY
jgi:hypothetical protein